jgi:Sulfotransferase family
MRPDVTDVDTPFLFIVGCGRSGTTMLRSMFDSHPDMAIPGESGFIWKRKPRYESTKGFDAQGFVDYLTGHRRFRRWGLDPSEVRRTILNPVSRSHPEALRRLYRLYADSRDKERFGDKTPSHVMRIPLLTSLFTEARIVHLIRDGRNVCMSYMDIREWGPSGVAEAARYWKRRVEQGRRDGRALGPERYQEVTYEALVEHPETELRRLSSFAGLAFHDSMLRYFERAPEVLTTEMHPHRHQSLFKPPTKGVRDWRQTMEASDVARFEAVAGKTLSEFGYERGFKHLPSSARVKARVDVGASQLRRTQKLAKGAGRKVQRQLRLSSSSSKHAGGK